MKSIMSKIALGFGAILLVSIVSSAISVLVDRQVRKQASVVVERTLPALSYVSQIDHVVQSMQLATLSLYGTTLSLAEFDQLVAVSGEQLERSMAGLKGSAAVDLRPLTAVTVASFRKCGSPAVPPK